MPMTEPAFELHPRLAADSLPVCSLSLCAVHLMNDARFPWLLLVPRRPALTELLDLSPADRRQCYQEIDQAAAALREIIVPDKLNIGALGNVVRQLHIHIIARFEADTAWPDPVWGKGTATPYEASAAAVLITRLQELLPNG